MIITNSSNSEILKIKNVCRAINGDLYSNHRLRLRRYEDEMLLKNYVRIVFFDEKDKDDNDCLNIINCSTFPFVFGEHDIKYHDVLAKLWSGIDCFKCKDVVYRRAFPTGNLNAEYLFVGEAPGVADGERQFERVMGYGSTSVLLRMALIYIGILKDCLFTNIMKCSLKDNKLKSYHQYDACADYFFNEVELVKPKTIVTLGNNVANYLSGKLDFVKVIHPSYCLYKGMNFTDYAKILRATLL